MGCRISLILPSGQRQLGNYRLLSYLSGGGFVDVYLAEHIHLKRSAAIKVLRSQPGQNAQEDFLVEAQRVAALRHPHIITILDFGIEGNQPYLVMDYASHGTLRKRHPRPSYVSLPSIITYIRQIASALYYAHQQRVVHRDVKPENILVGSNGEIFLSDFGIAIIAHTIETMTPQDVIGTYNYMAPEQAQGQARPESDQYALAVIVYEWLCGELPFTGNYPVEMTLHHLNDPPPPLSTRFPHIAPAVESVVFKALAKDPQQRYSTI